MRHAMFVKEMFMRLGKARPFAAVLCGVLAGAFMLPQIKASPANAATWNEGYLPNAAVFDQSGKKLVFYDDVIKGRIVVVSFIYTTCRDMCPLVTARLVRMQSLLAPDIAEKLSFVAISVDPETDTPQRLAEYADTMGATLRWTFLTGQKKDIDVIRHKLGERSAKPSEHRMEVLLGNDATGEWERASAMGDLGILAMTVRAMDPVLRNQAQLVSAEPAPSLAEEHPGQGLFIKACAACHTVGGGDRVGPDLAGLTARRERSWIVRYITAPNRLRARKDPIALKLGQKFERVRMPNLGIAEAEADELIRYIESRPRAE
ncbi:MAG: SCO family protein [Aestuariivirga sp.]